MKRFILLSIVVILIFTVIPPLSIRAESTQTSSDIYYDADMDAYIFKTTDKLKSSKTYFKTVGFTISRTELGIQRAKEPSEYITVSIRDLDKTEGMQLDSYEDGYYVYTTWAISKSYVWGKIETEHPDWADELFTTYTMQTWLKFDALIVIYENEVAQGGILGDSHIIHKDVYGNVSMPKLQSVDNLTSKMRSLGFSTASIRCIPNHFNKYLPYALIKNTDEPEYDEPELHAPEDEFIETIGKSKPDFHTWNSSDKYDLSKGIPSSENVTNHTIIDEFYGTADIGLHKEPHTWKFSSTIQWYTITYTYDRQGKHSHKNWHEEAYYPIVERQSWYYYLQDCNFYTYTKADVLNEAFPNDQINYVNENPVEINFKVNGQLNPEHVSSWIPLNDGEGTHIIWKEDYDYNIGTVSGGSSKSLAKQRAYNIGNIRISNSEWGLSWNDLLQINHKKYLDDIVITHTGNQ